MWIQIILEFLRLSLRHMLSSSHNRPWPKTPFMHKQLRWYTNNSDTLSHFHMIHSNGCCKLQSWAKTIHGAVRAFGGLHYEKPAESYCHELWVKECISIN